MPNIDAFLAGLNEAREHWPMTAGWIDCVSARQEHGPRHPVQARWATPEEAPRRPPRPKPAIAIPFDCPSFVLGPLSIRAFNTLLLLEAPAARAAGHRAPRGVRSIRST